MELDSTNTYALELIAKEKSQAKDTVITAQSQTAGRGRLGRQWNSPKGNLYTSIIIDPKDDQATDLGLYAQMASLAIIDTIQRGCHLGPRLVLKWPNDVLIDGKKVAGLLLEKENNTGFLVIGIGVNLKSHPEGLPYPASDILNASGYDLELTAFLNTLLQDFDLQRQRLRSNMASVMIKEWAAMLAHKMGDNITVRLPNNEIKGQYEGLDPSGRLQLKLADGTMKFFYSGDVFF